MTQDTSPSAYFSRFKFVLYSNRNFESSCESHFRCHVTEYCAVIGTHSKVRVINCSMAMSQTLSLSAELSLATRD